MILDCHTHDPQRHDSGIVNGSPSQVELWSRLWPDGCFSVGIHPWDTGMLSPLQLQEEWRCLRRVAALPQVVAIGETGLDALRGAPLDVQESLFLRHVDLSEELGKPLILHVVKSGGRFLSLRKKLLPKLTRPWVWHGFRGKPRLAQQFLSMSTASSPLYISLGPLFNPATAACVPYHVLLAETDDSPVAIGEVIGRISIARGGAVPPSWPAASVARLFPETFSTD